MPANQRPGSCAARCRSRTVSLVHGMAWPRQRQEGSAKAAEADGHGASDCATTGSFGEDAHHDKRQGKSGTIDVKALLREDEEFLRALVRTALQEVLEAEITGGAGRREGRVDSGAARLPVGLLRTDADHADWQARAVGAADRAGWFSTELFERYQRSEWALVAAPAEMYVQGVSTRKVATHAGVRESRLIGLMVYDFARIGAAWHGGTQCHPTTGFCPSDYMPASAVLHAACKTSPRSS
jgi:hypothetical protein